VIEGHTYFFSNGQNENLTNWFGRLDLGGDVTIEASTVRVRFRLYPAGLGHDFRGPGVLSIYLHYEDAV
jgi:hypothetical protein